MTLDGLTLPDTLQWDNEHSWHQVGQTQDRSVTGAMIYQEQRKSYGREIDLVDDGGDSAWVAKSVIDALYAKEYELNKKMPLTLPDGQQFTVRFNRAGGPAIQAERVWLWEGIPDADTTYVIRRLRLITTE